jgi:hypothetical protein
MPRRTSTEEADMGLLDSIREAFRKTRDPNEELARAQKQADVEAMKRDDQMKVRMPPSNRPR